MRGGKVLEEVVLEEDATGGATYCSYEKTTLLKQTNSLFIVLLPSIVSLVSNQSTKSNRRQKKQHTLCATLYLFDPCCSIIGRQRNKRQCFTARRHNKRCYIWNMIDGNAHFGYCYHVVEDDLHGSLLLLEHR